MPSPRASARKPAPGTRGRQEPQPAAAAAASAIAADLPVAPPVSTAPEETTIGDAGLVIAGSEARFRDFVADLFAAMSGMQSVRRSLGRATGLTGSEVAMLLAIRRLSEQGCIGVKSIAEHLHVAGPHVTAEIGKLVEAGLVEKRVASSDHRAVDIRLTEEGEHALRRLTPLVRAANDVLFAGMSPDEMEHVHTFLKRLIATSAMAVEQVES